MTRTGTGTWAGWGEESTYKTAVAPSHFLPLEGGDEAVNFNVEDILVEHMAERGIDIADVLKGMKKVEGTYAHALRFGGGWAMFLAHLVRETFSTAGTGPYTHTLDIGGNASSLNGKGISLSVFKDGLLASSDNDWRYYGIRPTAGEITAEQGNKLRASWTLLGASADFPSHATASYPSDSYAKGPSDDSSPVAAVKFGPDGSETSYVTKNWSVRFEQPHEERYDFHDPEMLEPYPNGHLVVAGSFEVEWPSTGSSGDAFTADYRARTARSLLLEADGPDKTTEKVAFDFPKVLITSPPDVHPQDHGVIKATVEWRAFRDGANNEGTLTLLNGDANPY